MFLYKLCICYISLIFGLVDIAFAKFPTMVRDKTENSKNGNINVILFLAGMGSNLSCPPEEIPCVKIPLVGKVKPCPSRPDNGNGYPTNFGAIVKRCHKAECDCRKLLETSIITLNSWARNALQMTTAVVSLTHDEKTNHDDNEFKYYSYKLETIDSITPKSKSNGETDDVVIISSEHKNCNKPNSKENFPRLSNSLENSNKNLFQASKDVPNANAFISKSMSQFKRHSGDGKVPRFQRNYIIEPENTQVFEMDAAFNEDPNANEIVNLPVFRRSSKPDPFWDLLGIMSAMRKSFFGNYMNPSSDPQQRMAEEENGGNYNSLGKKQELSLFKLVKTTFVNIKEQSRENNKGFIIIIFGGNFSEISNPYSDFIQSIKYVEESSCPEKTLIIVSGDCPDNMTALNGNGNGNGDNGGRYERNKEVSIPVYAKGPSANIIAKAKDLPDIPTQIKAVLNKKSDECKQMNMRNLDIEGANKIDKDENIFSKYLMEVDDANDAKNKEKPKVIVKRDVSKMYQSGSIKKLLNKFAIYMWCILYFISFM